MKMAGMYSQGRHKTCSGIRPCKVKKDNLIIITDKKLYFVIIATLPEANDNYFIGTWNLND